MHRAWSTSPYRSDRVDVRSPRATVGGMCAERLVDRSPELASDELVAALVPPPRFDEARFCTYVPNPDEPSQAEAVAACSAFADRTAKARAHRGFGSLF